MKTRIFFLFLDLSRSVVDLDTTACTRARTLWERLGWDEATTVAGRRYRAVRARFHPTDSCMVSSRVTSCLGGSDCAVAASSKG